MLYAVGEACREMSSPTTGSWARVERMARYLKGKPRLVWRFGWQDSCAIFDEFTDANRAGCRRTRKSTSGGCIMVGDHCIKSWAKTQSLIAKSSAESEVYAVVKASTETLGIMTLARELGDELKSRVHVDAAAAKGTVERSSLVKVRHIDVGVLRLQEQAARERVPLHKIDGAPNPAELMTKHLCSNKIEHHIRRQRLEFRGGRAEAAAQLRSVDDCGPQEVIDEEEFIRGCEAIVVEYLKRQWKERRTIGQSPGPGGANVGQALGHGGAQDLGQARGHGGAQDYGQSSQGGDAVEGEAHEKRGGDGDDSDDDGQGEVKAINIGGDGGAVGKSEDSDRWICRGRSLTWIREPRTSRSELFSPGEAARGPFNLSRLWNIRKREGVMEDGRRFEIIDDWTRQDEHKVSSLGSRGPGRLPSR